MYSAIGLMSGTSCDGIDVAHLESDGVSIASTGGSMFQPFTISFKERLTNFKNNKPILSKLEMDLTLLHVEAIRSFLNKEQIDAKTIDVVGFHGHTLEHKPEQLTTLQIGDGHLLADKITIPVINDFRTNDIKKGGQGAPLVPVFHVALAQQVKKPVAILNIGGVANVTWIGSGKNEVIGFDTGPGNGMLDHWIRKHGMGDFDNGGIIASKGIPDLGVINKYMQHKYFATKPPKSLDRDQFSMDYVDELALEDGASTLTAFTVEAVRASETYFPENVDQWIVCGGGRHNEYMMESLEKALKKPVIKSDQLGWDGDMIEAQAFGFLAIRSLLSMPISYPSTTGVKTPETGGVLHQPN